MSLIKNLPLDKVYVPTQEEIHTVHTLFNPVNQTVILSTMSSFKLAFLAGIIYLVFSFPFVTQLADVYTKSNVLSKILLTGLVIVTFFLIQKLFLNS